MRWEPSAYYDNTTQADFILTKNPKKDNILSRMCTHTRSYNQTIDFAAKLEEEEEDTSPVYEPPIIQIS